MTRGAPAGRIVGGVTPHVHTADDLASAVGGVVVGDGATGVRAIAPLERACEDELTFLARPQYASLLAQSRAGVVLISPELAGTQGAARARIIVDKPYEALLELLPRFYAPPLRTPGIHPTAAIGRGVQFGDGVTVGPYVVLGDGVRLGARAWVEAQSALGPGVEIGEDSHIHPGVVIYSGSMVGRRVVLHAGVRLGSDGFGYVFRGGVHQKLPHVGRCIVQDDVEIGANTTVDRGSVDDTVIGAGTKIDNLVHVAHNVRIGHLCLILAQVGIAGSARIGDGAIIAGQAGIGGHIEVGPGARIGGQAGVLGDVPAGESWSGYPARPHRESLRAHAAMFKLSGLLKRIERLLAAQGE